MSFPDTRLLYALCPTCGHENKRCALDCPICGTRLFSDDIREHERYVALLNRERSVNFWKCSGAIFVASLFPVGALYGAVSGLLVGGWLGAAVSLFAGIFAARQVIAYRRIGRFLSLPPPTPQRRADPAD